MRGGEFSKFAYKNWREDTKGALRVVTVGNCPKRGSKLFALKANVFFMTVKNVQKLRFSIFQNFLLQFAPNEDKNLFL